MGEKLSLKLDPRDVQGKKVAKLRKEGIVPGVIYGSGISPINVQIAINILEKTYRVSGTHSPIHLSIDGKKKIAMIKDVERDPAKGTIRHVSFHAVKANEPVVAEVPIRLVGEGESEAEKNGLIVLQALEKIEVKALPMNLPDAIEVSIVALKDAGDKVTLGDVVLTEGVEFVEHDTGHEVDEEKPHITDLMVASVWEPSALQAANEAAAGDGEEEADVPAENGDEESESSENTEVEQKTE